MRTYHSARKSFTLLELLLATSLLAFVGLGVYRTLSSGIAVWQWFGRNRPSADVAIFLEKVALDVRNYCDFSLSDFEGAADRISFLTRNPDYVFLSSAKALPSGITQDVFNRVEYVFVPDSKQVKRRVYKFGFNEPKTELVNLSGIRNFRFSFYVWDERQKAVTKAHLLSGQTPKAIEVEVELDSASGATDTINRIIEIPI